MTTNAAIVDDQDPLVQYAGTWNRAGAAEEFDSTTTWSATAGTTASFPFVGTSITVYGTVAALNLSPQVSMSFVVDGSVTGTYTPPNNMTADIHHEPLWTSPSSSLNNDSHTLVIKQTAAASGGVIFLDYIIYSTTSTSVSSYFIDDRDARIQYTPAWRLFGSEGDFQHTSQASTSMGDRFSLKFDGKAISFYGGVTSLTANASMTIDGGPPKFWVPPTTAATTNNLIYNSGDLSPGTHTLVVTAQNGQPVWADYFLVTPNPPGSTSSASTSATSTPSPSITPPPSHKSTPIGAIVGPVVGVLVLIALVAAFFLCRRRRRRVESPDPPMSTVPGPAPFSDFGAAGPPLGLSHGYAAYAGPSNQNSPFAASSNHSSPFVASSDPNSPFVAPSNPNSSLAAVGGDHNSVFAASSDPNSQAGYPVPRSSGTIASTASNSTASEDNNMNPAPPVRTGVLPSNKLLREARRWHVSAPSTSSASSSHPDGQELPPHYSE
ncbi:hypothetical protein B0H13DRAFT_2005851 [Mycena leptocephala]|nr:hypothetical protein B0H13DRAFT_2005851 [Mycena leptocephala]